MDFGQKRRALMTGASSGIGTATALVDAKAGIDVALVSRFQDKLESVAKRMFVKSKLTQKLAIGNRVYTGKTCLRRLKILVFSLVHAGGLCLYSSELYSPYTCKTSSKAAQAKPAYAG